jgi:hypothetical protein
VSRRPPLELRIGDVVRTRKPHPCGGDMWEITRTGADIGIRCTRCKHHVFVPRIKLEHRIREFVSRGPAAPADPQ